MNSVSPSAAQYVTGTMQDELVENQRQQPLEHQGSFGPRLPQTIDPGRELTGEPDEMDKLKAKLMSAWNNVKYGLPPTLFSRYLSLLSVKQYLLTYVHFITVGWTVKSKTTFNKVSPVTILGHSYLLNSEGTL